MCDDASETRVAVTTTERETDASTSQHTHAHTANTHRLRGQRALRLGADVRLQVVQVIEALRFQLQIIGNKQTENNNMCDQTDCANALRRRTTKK